MIEVRLNDKHIVLTPDAQLDLDLSNNLFATGIEDDFTIPLQAPAQGNEDALDFVHILANNARNLRFTGATLGYSGTDLFPGNIEVLAANDDEVSLSFVPHAFAVRIKGLMLPDLIRHIVIPFPDVDAPLAGYQFGGMFQLPMHLNPSLYGDANPGWMPNTSDWNPSSSYAINDLVKFTTSQLTPDHPIERTAVWQCTATASAGQSPETHPAKWRRVAFGIVNAWDHANNKYYRNTTGRYYSFVPWFYHKWVLTKALEAVGFKAVGEFMKDARTHELLMPNAATIDRDSGQPSEYLFRVSHLGDVNYIDDPASFRLHATDEASGDNTDPDNLWNTSTHQFTCPAPGQWKFTFNYAINESTDFFSSPYYDPFVTMRRADGSQRALSGPRVRKGHYFRLLGGRMYSITGYTNTLVLTMDAADVGQAFHFTVHADASSFHPEWPQADVDLFTDTTKIEGYVMDPDPGPQQPDDELFPYRHVPNVPLADYLNALCAAFALKLTPDVESGTLSIDYRRSAIDALHHPVTDATPRLRSPVKLDLAQATSGIRLTWDLRDLTTEEVRADEILQTYTSERELPVPTLSGLRAVLLNTREFLVSVFKDGRYFWRPKGYYVPDTVVGDPESATEVKPDLKPLHMATTSLDGRPLALPVLDHAGCSLNYGINNDFKDLYMAVFSFVNIGPVTGPGDLDPAGNPIPFLEIQGPQARSWGYLWGITDPTLTLQWKEDSYPPMPFPATELYRTFHQPWVQAQVDAEPVTFDLEVDLPTLRARQWQAPLHIDGQLYLLKNLPLSLGNTAAPILAQRVQALRLRTGAPPFVPQPLVLPMPLPQAPQLCTQPTSIHIEVPAGETVDLISISTNPLDPFDEYFMVEDDATVYSGGTTLSSGKYCLYTTDSGGNVSGSPVSIFLLSSTLTTLDGGQLADMEYIDLYADGLTTLDVSAWTSAVHIDASLYGLTTLDVSAWTAATNIGLYADGLTTLDVSAWTAATTIGLYANGLTTLDVSAWTAATIIGLYANGLTTLDASTWTAAWFITLSGSALASLTVPASFAANVSGGFKFTANITILDQASVDAILASAVANASIVSGTINLGGGCAAPSASGYTDKSTLQGRGLTVITN